MGWLGDMFDPGHLFFGGDTLAGSTAKYQDRTLESFGKNPYASPLQGFLDSGGTRAQIAPAYDAMRSRLNTAYVQQQQQGQDAIDRQFAAAGGGPGNGVQQKQTENLTAGTEKAKGFDLDAINAQQGMANIEASKNDVGVMGQIAGLHTGWDQAAEQANNDAYNMVMNNYKAKHSGGLLGGGGFLGLGIGGG